MDTERPTGVPDDAVPMTVWLGREGKPEWDDYGREASWCVIFLPDGTDYDSWDADDLRKAGVPVPPYQPAPDPEALLVEKITADWTHLDPADSAPPVAGERTGPLGLNEGDRVRHMTSGRIAAFVRYAPRGMMLVESIESGERCIYAPELWEPVRDAQLEPAETLADIEAWLRSDARDETYLTPKGMSALADRIEAARNRERETPAGACQRCAAAGLPQEPTEGGQQ